MCQEWMGQQVPRVMWGTEERLDPQDLKENREMLEVLGQLGYKALGEDQELQEKREHKEPMERLENVDRMAKMVGWDPWESRAWQGDRVWLETQGLWDTRARKVHQDLPAQQDLVEMLARRASQGAWDCQGIQDQPEIEGPLVDQGQGAFRAYQEDRERME